MLRKILNFRFRLTAAIVLVAVGATVTGLFYYYQIVSRQIWSQMTNRVKDFGKVGVSLFNPADIKYLEKLDLDLNPAGRSASLAALADEEKTAIIRKNEFQYVVQKLRRLRFASGKDAVHEATLAAKPETSADQPQIHRVWIAGVRMHEYSPHYLRVLCADEFEEIDRNNNRKIDPEESIYHIGDIFNGRGQAAIASALKGEIAVSHGYRAESSGVYITGYTPIRNARGQLIAVLIVDFSAATEFDALFNLKITGYYIIVGVLFFSILAAAATSRLLLKPLDAMQQAAIRIGQRDFSIRVKADSTDELSDLAYAMNLMAHELGEYSTNMEKRISARTREISGILGALEQGLLTIDNHGVIQAEHSRAALSILGVGEIAHRKLSSLFRNETLRTAIDKYVEVFFFGNNISEQMLEKANPVRELEYQPPQGDIRHLRFRFTPLTAENGTDVSRILVSILDDTHEVTLRQKITLAEADKKSEFDILINLMQIPPTVLENFITQQKNFLHRGKNLITRFDSLPASEIVVFATEVHALKGNAAQLGFNPLAELLHDLEEYLGQKIAQTAGNAEKGMVADNKAGEPTLHSDKFLRHEISRFINAAENLILSREKLAERIQALVGNPESDDPAMRLRRLSNFWVGIIEQRAARKEVPVVVQVEFQPGTEDAVHMLHNVIVQLLRNTFAHGIESPEERMRRGKKAELSIGFRIEKTATETRAIYTEDGRGFTGIGTGSSVPLYSLSQKGLTAANSSTSLEAGRGLGLEYIVTTIESLGGTATLTFSGRFTEIQILLPV